MAKPILVMQMQRMGDLILSFPLFLWLERQFPGHPIWVLAEKSFYEPLMPISPQVTYFPWEGTGVLKQHEFALILNLSIRSQAATLAGQLTAEETLGPVTTKNGTFIRGDWQLYRASVVRNNRYNRFHWADLNALDVIPLSRMARTRYDASNRKVVKHPQVGLFLGASDPAKHPSARFWAELCARLVDRNIKPALFGGPAEQSLGAEVLERFGRPVANFCGTFGLDQLSRAMSGLALFVSPDTGPMHLAAWNGCPTLNLSMGNVSPWETGPYPPGHTILRAELPCSPGCWECSRSRLHCHDPFDVPQGPDPIAAFIARTVKGRPPSNPPANMTLARSDRTASGLYRLHFTGDDPMGLLGQLWESFFGWQFGLWDEAEVRGALQTVAQSDQELGGALLSNLSAALGTLTGNLASRSLPRLWESSPKMIQPFTGWSDLVVENENGSPAGFERVLEAGNALHDLLRSALS